MCNQYKTPFTRFFYILFSCEPVGIWDVCTMVHGDPSQPHLQPCLPLLLVECSSQHLERLRNIVSGPLLAPWPPLCVPTRSHLGACKLLLSLTAVRTRSQMNADSAVLLLKKLHQFHCLCKICTPQVNSMVWSVTRCETQAIFPSYQQLFPSPRSQSKTPTLNSSACLPPSTWCSLWWLKGRSFSKVTQAASCLSTERCVSSSQLHSPRALITAHSCTLHLRSVNGHLKNFTCTELILPKMLRKIELYHKLQIS